MNGLNDSSSKAGAGTCINVQSAFYQVYKMHVQVPCFMARLKIHCHLANK